MSYCTKAWWRYCFPKKKKEHLCSYCGKPDGNSEIWVSRHGFDPPDCYCSRGKEKNPPCKDYGCYADVTRYPCPHCKKRIRWGWGKWKNKV